MREGWRTKTLSDVAQFSNGLWKGKKPPYVNVGVIRNTNFTREGTLDDSDIAYIDVEVKQLAKRQLEFGDIILEKSGGGPKQPVGRVALFEKSDGIYSFSNFTSSIRILRPAELDFRFLHKFLHWIYLSGHTVGMQSHSTGIRNLNGNSYKSIKISYPPLHEQRRIVEILDGAFAAIATATAAVETNLQNARSLFESLLTDLLRNRTGLWPERRLEDLLIAQRKISYGVVKPGPHDPDGVRLIKSQQVRDNWLNLTEDFRITEGLDREYARTRLQGGEVLLNLVGASIGRSAIAPVKLKGANISRAIALIPVKHEIAQWVQYNLRCSVGQALIQAKTGGSAQPVLNLSEVKSLSIPVPSLSEQKEITERLDVISAETDRLTTIYERKLAALVELKQSLLHQAFTGQLTAGADAQLAETLA